MSSGFFQMGISKESTKYTAFNTCFGTYKFLRLPMGLSTAPNSFQLLMDKVLRGLTFRSVLCYLDDVLICSNTYEKHIQDLEDVFFRLKNAGLKLGPRKCSFARAKCIFLGHEISKDGIRPPPERIEAIVNYPTPTNVKELRRAMGLFNWFRKFIPRFSEVAFCLNQLLRKGVHFRWTEDHQHAFDTLKSLLISSDALSFPRYDLEFCLAVDTSSKGVGYMLYQIHPDGKNHVVRFGSKGLNTYQQTYGPTKLELLGMVFSVLDCAHYLRGRRFTVECDHQALQPLFQKQLRGAIYERWLAILQQFDINIVYKPAKHMVVADALSRCHPNSAACAMESSPAEDDPYFPYVPDTHAVGLTLPSGQRFTSLLHSDVSEPEANNICILHPPLLTNDVYEAYDGDTEDIAGDTVNSKSTKKKGRTVKHSRNRRGLTKDSNGTLCREDQFTAVNHPDQTDVKSLDPCNSEIWRTRTSELHAKTDEFSVQTEQDDTNILCQPTVETTDTEPFNVVLNYYQQDTEVDDDSSVHICDATEIEQGQHDSQANSFVRDSAKEAVSDANKCEIFKVTDFTIEHLVKLQHQDVKYSAMIKYLKDDELPLSQKNARRILLESSDFALFDDVLFHSHVPKSQRTKTFNYYRLVVPELLVPTILSIYHDSTIGSHGGIKETLDRIQEHYFFPKLTKIVSDYVRSCSHCQKRKMSSIPRGHTVTAFPTPSRPFKVWEADLYGPLPTTPSGKTYIFTAVDLFSKFLHAIPIAAGDALSVGVALFQLLCTFGVCETLISDQGSEFMARATKELCRLTQLQQNLTPSFSHHCLGACERTHRVLATKLTPYMNGRRNNWEEILPAVVFSINISVNAASGYSPFEVIFGQRPAFPLLYVPPDLETIPQDIHTYICRVRDKLDIIHTNVKENIEKAQDKMKESANLKVRPLQFSVGDYVFLHQEPSGIGQKLQNFFKGPFVIHEIPSPHLVLLYDPSAKKIMDKPFHVNRLKIAHVRAPTPTDFFRVTTTCKVDKNVQTTHFPEESLSALSESSLTSPDPNYYSAHTGQSAGPLPPIPRPRRSIRKPARYCSSDVDPALLSSDSSCPQRHYKVKRILAQRGKDSEIEYLVQFAGEPAQNALWVKFCDLNQAAQSAVRAKPPKTVS